MGNGENILICIDRDGTILYDKNYHLGSQKNWKSLIKFLPGVINGLRTLKKIPNSKIYITTNQPGVAIKEFPLLTKRKAKEVCHYVLYLLKNKKVELDGCEVCGYASLEYVERKKRGYTFDKKLIGNYSCIKPKPGMINNILKKLGWSRKHTKIYIIGDRESDVKTAGNINGFGILVPFSRKPDEPEKVRKLKSRKKYIAKNFADAVKFVLKKEKVNFQ